jgi:hypothetical protein
VRASESVIEARFRGRGVSESGLFVLEMGLGERFVDGRLFGCFLGLAIRGGRIHVGGFLVAACPVCGVGC